MFSHVMLGVNNLEASKKFYDALLGTLGIAPGVANKNRYFYRSPTGTFAITTPINGQAATHGNGSTLGFSAKSIEQADAFHAAGVAHGGTSCEDPPGYREGAAGKIYLAYLRDPDGNLIELLTTDGCAQPARWAESRRSGATSGTSVHWQDALVAQGIEHRPPEPVAQVQL